MSISDILTEFHIGPTPRAIIIIIAGYFIARLVSKGLSQVLQSQLSVHQNVLLRRFSFYLLLLLFIISAVEQLGFHMSTLLGATGILTIAIGIASQASISNVISGIFIIAEKPFEIGNTIKINEVQGEVISVDLLSVQIRTSDNTLVRIPNEMLIKSAVTNFSYFSTRRLDFKMGVAYKENLDHLKKILFGIATHNPLCLQKPAPLFAILDLNPEAIEIQFSVWTKKDSILEAKNALQAEIKTEFLKHNIEMPFPTYSLHTAASTAPFPVKVTS